MVTAPPPPSTPAPSASLILVRKQAKGIQTYLLRRSSASPFMPNTYVFPGGRLDDGDMDNRFWLDHVDLSADQLPQVVGGHSERMLPYAVAAIRETWEEAGLLLASGDGRSVEDVGSNECGGLAFKPWIAANRFQLSVSKLGRWHHWTTPVLMPRRFETFFFVTPVASNQTCRPDNHETVHGTWISPREALTDNAVGKLPLSPPTIVSLHQLLSFGSLDALVAETRRRSWPASIMPRLWPLDDGALIIEPWDPDYHREAICLDTQRLEADVLPVGAPFSRLWRYNGICRPVRHPLGLADT